MIFFKNINLFLRQMKAESKWEDSTMYNQELEVSKIFLKMNKKYGMHSLQQYQMILVLMKKKEHVKKTLLRKNVYFILKKNSF